MTPLPDDGIVVVGFGKECVVMQRVSGALRERLGEQAARDLEDYAAGLGNEWSDEVMHTATERFDNRLVTVAAEIGLEMAGMRSDIRNEMHQGFERIWQAMADLRVGLRQEIADTRVELLRWSFLFWIGEVAVLVGVLAFMLRGVAAG